MVEETPGRRQEQRDERERKTAREQPPETSKRPARGVRHEPEPDAGNIVPIEDEPGTV